MEIASRERAEPFTTLDGSTVRELLAARYQSLAEATLAAGQATQRHYHAETEEIYVVLEGSGAMEVDGDRSLVVPGDAVLIPSGAWHQLRAEESGELRILCCCAPPYRDDDTFFE